MELFVPTGIDRYQKPVGETYTVQNVHIQSDNRTHKTADNTEVSLTGIIFIDARRSEPALDYWALQRKAHEAGSVMTCKVTGRNGSVSGPYTILVVDGLPDDEDNLHHWEIGVV
jgi:hypothetical protein